MITRLKALYKRAFLFRITMDRYFEPFRQIGNPPVVERGESLSFAVSRFGKKQREAIIFTDNKDIIGFACSSFAPDVGFVSKNRYIC